MKFFNKSSIILTCLFFLQLLNLSAQEKDGITFEISNPTKSTIDLSNYVVAVVKSDFSCFRFKQNRRILYFDNGVKLELFSIDELMKSGNAPKSACFTEYNTKLHEQTLQLVGETILIAANPDGGKGNTKPTK